MATTYSIAKAATVPLLSGSGATRTFTYTPIALGNFALFCVAWQPSTATMTSLTLPNSSLFFFGSSTHTVASLGGTLYAQQQYVAIPVTNLTPQTFSITFSASVSFINIDYIEFTANSIAHQNGFWLWQYQEAAVTSGATVINWAVPGIFSNDDMFVGFTFPNTSPVGTNGTPAGFNYQATSDANGFCENLTYGAQVTAPHATQSSGGYYTQAGRLAWIPETIPSGINYGSY
jgi:hypothetical protein